MKRFSKSDIELILGLLILCAVGALFLQLLPYLIFGGLLWYLIVLITGDDKDDKDSDKK